MDLYPIKPRYRSNPVKSIAALARGLRWDAQSLVELADRANGMWRTVKPKPGSTRQTFDAMGQLKAALPHLPVIGNCNNQAVSHYLTHWLDTPNLPYSPE